MKFLIIGHMNAITYKEVFPLIKNNKVWLGVNNNQSFVFESPYENTLEDNKKFCEQKGYNGDKYIKVPGINWYTNLPHKKRNEKLILVKDYHGHEDDYRKYDNYDAIEVSRVVNIPKDYAGNIGVPITFLDKYNPKQFEIVGLGISNSGLEIGVKPYTEEHKKYRKEVQKRAAVNGDLYMVENGIVKVPYARILIKRR